MSAVLVDEVKVRARRKIDNRERSALEGELERWGKWHEDFAECTGYKSSDAVAAYLEGAGGGQAGPIIPIEMMPNKVYWTNLRVLALPDRQRDAIFIKYVCATNDGGQLITDEQRAQYLGISREAYGMLLTRAKQRMLGIGSDYT